jgi:hypothetical protein
MGFNNCSAILTNFVARLECSGYFKLSQRILGEFVFFIVLTYGLGCFFSFFFEFQDFRNLKNAQKHIFSKILERISLFEKIRETLDLFKKKIEIWISGI